MNNHPLKGDFSEALVKILLTFYRAIRRVNLLYDPLACGEQPGAGPSENPTTLGRKDPYEEVPPVL